MPAHFPENELFLTPCPKSLLSANAHDFENRHEAWVRDQISLGPGWYRQFMYSTYPIPTVASCTALLYRSTNDRARRRDRLREINKRLNLNFSVGFSERDTNVFKGEETSRNRARFLAEKSEISQRSKIFATLEILVSRVTLIS